MTPLPPVPAERVRILTIAGIVAIVSADLAILRASIDRIDVLPPAVAGPLRIFVWGVLAVSTGALLAMVLLWRRMSDRAVSWIVLAFFLVLGVAPGLVKGVGRVVRGPTAMVFDTILHVEVAARLLTEGRNPYEEEYGGTELGQWHEGRDRFQMHHFVYPPLGVLLTVPFRALFSPVGGYDSRFLLMPLLGAAFAIGWRAWARSPWRPLLLALAFLNPLLFGHHHGGKLDTLVLFLVVLGLRFASEGRPLAFAGLLGLAAATKTNFILAFPFGLAWCASTRREEVRFTLAWLAAFVPWFVPFLAWNPAALIEDLVVAPSRGAASDPLLVDAGPFGGAWLARLPGATSGFPFWAVQWPLTLAVGVMGFLETRRSRAPLAFGLAAAATLGVFFYFNRFSDSAYFGTFLAIVAAGAGFQGSSKGPAETAPAGADRPPGPVLSER
jgi:hypothetical protein